MRSLRDEPDAMIDGNRIYGRHNAMKIDYNGRSSIVIALQDAHDRQSETLIHVRPERIAIGARYRIVGENLNERFERSGIGHVNMQAPQATVHVLIIVERLFDWIVSLQVTYPLSIRRFFLEWERLREGNQVEQAIHVNTAYSFDFNEAMKVRPAMGDKATYYRGYDPKEAAETTGDTKSEQLSEDDYAEIAADVVNAVMKTVDEHVDQSEASRDDAEDDTEDFVIEEEILITTNTNETVASASQPPANEQNTQQ